VNLRIQGVGKEMHRRLCQEQFTAASNYFSKSNTASGWTLLFSASESIASTYGIAVMPASEIRPARHFVNKTSRDDDPRGFLLTKPRTRSPAIILS
jgi:hypothetical protein